MTEDRAARFRELMNTNVWLDIKAEADDIALECEEYINNALLNHPEKLTAKTAIAKGNRARGVLDLIETIESAGKR